MRLPVIVGFGGYNAAGRVSFHHAFRRTVIDAVDASARLRTYAGLAKLMGVNSDPGDLETQKYIDSHTLIRRIELWDPDQIHINKAAKLRAGGDGAIRFTLSDKQMPTTLPDGWHVVGTTNSRVQIEVEDSMRVLVDEVRRSKVTSAGQLPTGFDPGSYYASRAHPRGLQLAVLGASDAMMSTGLDWELLRQKIRPDDIAVSAGSALGQLDEEGNGGLLQAPYIGKRPTSKQAALGLPEMAADFVNAYVCGGLGSTCGAIGACATFLYNLKQGIDQIRFGGKRIAIVGSAEAPVTPELVESFRTMGALAPDEDICRADRTERPDNRRACRPFSTNFGFTMAEGSSYLILMDDELALETGANIHGAVADVYINADGYKKSISGPGIGNYLTVGKALGLARSIIGEPGIKHRSFVHAHGTGTPQNRVTESHILNEMAKTFGIEQWNVAAVKAYLGHTMAPASGDQLTSALGSWQEGLIPGIATIDHIADDVHASNLRLGPDHIEIDPNEMELALVNSKGFGGNNATGVVLSPQLTRDLLNKRHGRPALTDHARINEPILAESLDYDEAVIAQGPQTIYRFNEGVLGGEDLQLDIDQITVKGYDQSVDLQVENPYC